MGKAYIYIYYEYGDFYISDRPRTAEELMRDDGEYSDWLYGEYDNEEELGKAVTRLFEEGRDLLPCTEYADIVKKYCPARFIDKWQSADEKLRQETRHMLYLESGEEEIRRALEDNMRCRLANRYGLATEDDPLICRRLNEEWHTVGTNGNLLDIAVLHEIAEWMRQEGRPFRLLGSSASSLLLYLLGITRCDPLPPHYSLDDHVDVLRGWHSYYPEVSLGIKWVLPQSRCKDGFDLPQMPINGGGLYGDGHDIPWQILWPDNEPSYFEVDLPAAMLAEFKDWLGTHWLFRLCPEIPVECPSADRMHFSHVQLHFILEDGEARLFDIPDRTPAEVAERAVSTWQELVVDGDESVAAKMRGCGGFPPPRTFADVVYLYGLLRGEGTWGPRTVRDLTEQRRGFSDIIAFKDDVFSYLKAHGYSDAFASWGKRCVNAGRGLPEVTEEMQQAADGWVAERCGSIHGLLTKAHVIEHLLYSMERSS